MNKFIKNNTWVIYFLIYTICISFCLLKKIFDFFFFFFFCSHFSDEKEMDNNNLSFPHDPDIENPVS